VFSDHPRRALGGLYHCANFGWNRCSSFHNMRVLILSINILGVLLENAYSRPQNMHGTLKQGQPVRLLELRKNCVQVN